MSRNDTSKAKLPERITVLAEEFTPAAMEFHRRHMSARGYRMEGQITPRQFQIITNDTKPPETLFDGKSMFAVTFVRKDNMD